jgi:hypothetical protein
MVRGQETIYTFALSDYEGYGESDNGIHPKCRRTHQLQVGEILSIKSPTMFRNTLLGQAG